MQQIRNELLTLRDIPQPDASWSEILDFALTFDGYDYWGTFERCAEVAAARAHGTITGLRTCLFFEQRRWRNGDEMPPNKKTLKYWQSLVKRIRKLVQTESEGRAKLEDDEHKVESQDASAHRGDA